MIVWLIFYSSVAERRVIVVKSLQVNAHKAVLRTPAISISFSAALSDASIITGKAGMEGGLFWFCIRNCVQMSCCIVCTSLKKSWTAVSAWIMASNEAEKCTECKVSKPAKTLRWFPPLSSGASYGLISRRYCPPCWMRLKRQADQDVSCGDSISARPWIDLKQTGQVWYTVYAINYISGVIWYPCVAGGWSAGRGQ